MPRQPTRRASQGDTVIQRLRPTPQPQLTPPPRLTHRPRLSQRPQLTQQRQLTLLRLWRLRLRWLPTRSSSTSTLSSPSRSRPFNQPPPPPLPPLPRSPRRGLRPLRRKRKRAAAEREPPWAVWHANIHRRILPRPRSS